MAANVGLDLLNKNLSFFTVPAAFLCALGPHIYSISGAPKAYDNTNPRSFKENLVKDATLDEATKQRLTRAKLASENGFETLGLYAAAVVAANQAGVPLRTLNGLTLGYVASRVLYNVAYIHLSGTPNLARLRVIAWQASVGLSLTLFVKAGLAKMDTYVF